MDKLLNLYHLLPYPLKVTMASGQGFLLQHRRYGPETEKLVAEAHERESWSVERWQSFREEQLAVLLHHAATTVPYYRELWSKRRQKGDSASFELLENWPVLEKEPLRAHPIAFLSDTSKQKKLYRTNTSGTTGKSLTLWWSLETTRRWYALFEARCRRWHGVSLHSRWAILGGKLITPVTAKEPPFWVWNAPMRQLYMSAYHLSPAYIPAYLEALKRYQIEYLWGYTSSLVALAQEVIRNQVKDLKLKVILTNAEPLFPAQRKLIAEAFQCPVRETYGMAEAVAGAGECSSGVMHFWPESGVLETFFGNELILDGRVGDLVSTGLINSDMPLIRYRIGDRGRTPISEPCSCGCRLPILPLIEGRCDDVLQTRDGRLIGRLDPIFKEDLMIREAQIIQESLDRIIVKYVPAQGYTPAMGESIIARLHDRVGEIEVILEEVEAIPRSANGKFRAVISRLPRSDS